MPAEDVGESRFSPGRSTTEAYSAATAHEDCSRLPLRQTYLFQSQTMQEHCQLLSLKALFRATQKVYPNTSWDGTMQQTQLPASQSNSLFRTNSESLILFETASAATFLHHRPFHCSSNYHSCTGSLFPALAATSPAPATLFLHQQLPVLHQQLPDLYRWPSCRSVYQFCTSGCQSCTSDRLPAPADTSSHQLCTSDYQSWTGDRLPAPAITFLH